jgi:hypothetical protein
MKRLLLILFSLAAASSQAASPAPSVTPAATAPPCVAPEFRQFDFWLGHWKVIGPKGQQVGTSEISRVSEGCAIREQWTDSNGKGGMSLNYYDPAEKQWHQDWVGGDDTILHLHGGLEDGAMVMNGVIKGSKGTYLNRITWTPLPEGKVKQEWAISTDDGATWKTSFAGIYAKQ